MKKCVRKEQIRRFISSTQETRGSFQLNKNHSEPQMLYHLLKRKKKIIFDKYLPQKNFCHLSAIYFSVHLFHEREIAKASTAYYNNISWFFNILAKVIKSQLQSTLQSRCNL